MAKRKPTVRRTFLRRHYLETLSRRAWERATEEERRAYQRYQDEGAASLKGGSNVEIPLTFSAFLERMRRRAAG